jgi:uncharacterized protein YxjI
VLNKYHAKRTWSAIAQRTFDSMAEARRGEALRLMELAGEISDLEYQVRFVLSVKPRITYTADFRYTQDGQVIVEDYKGQLLRDTRTKISWVKEKFGIEVRLTK